MSGHLTISEIGQQADLWPDTLERARQFKQHAAQEFVPAIVTGAGTSAYAAQAVAAALPDALAKPTTDLLLDDLAPLRRYRFLISLARSGDSPESLAVVQRVQRELGHVAHIAITCNAGGRLANAENVRALVLDSRTNDQSLVMTGSFSNLVLAGIAPRHLELLSLKLTTICERFKAYLPAIREIAAAEAARAPGRVVFLASGALIGAAREGALKVLEMTAGAVPTQTETFLGLRHGPMSFLRPDTLVVCFLSADPQKRRYEDDLLEELHRKQLGRLVGIGAVDGPSGHLDVRVPPLAPGLVDELRTPFDIVFAQLLGVELSLRAGLDPDNPSPDGVIQRVVPGFRIHQGE